MINPDKTIYHFEAERSYDLDIPITDLFPGEEYSEIPSESGEDEENEEN